MFASVFDSASKTPNSQSNQANNIFAATNKGSSLSDLLKDSLDREKKSRNISKEDLKDEQENFEEGEFEGEYEEGYEEGEGFYEGELEGEGFEAYEEEAEQLEEGEQQLEEEEAPPPPKPRSSTGTIKTSSSSATTADSATRENLSAAQHNEKEIGSLQLKYLSMYPKQVRRWIMDARLPKGYYNEEGDWVFVDNTVTPPEFPSIEREDPQAYYRYAYYKHLSRNAKDWLKQKEKQLLADEGEVEHSTEETANIDALKSRIPSREITEADLEKGLPYDLRGSYRFGISAEEITRYPAKLKELLSFKYANRPEINRFRIQQAIKKWQLKPNDTGSPAVQGSSNLFDEM
jgi:hypothetical protein